MSIQFDPNNIVSIEGSVNIQPHITYYGDYNVNLIKNMTQYIEELEQKVKFEMRQKAKAREQRDEQTQLAKKYKDRLSVLLNKK